MDTLSIILRVAAVFFGILAGAFGILSLYSAIKTDRVIPYVQARKKSIKKGFLFLALTYLSLIIMAGFMKPDGLETLVFCLLGGLLAIGISYGIAYLQVTFLGKNEAARNVFDPPRDRTNKK